MAITNYFIDSVAILASAFFLFAGIYNLLTSSKKRIALHDKKLPMRIRLIAKVVRSSRPRASVNFGSKMPSAFDEGDGVIVRNLSDVPFFVFSAILPGMDVTITPASPATLINERLSIGAPPKSGLGLKLTNSAPKTTYSRGYIYEEAAIC